MTKYRYRKTHTVAITLHFDKPVTQREATRAASNSLYRSAIGHGGVNDRWEVMRVGAIRPLAQAVNREVDNQIGHLLRQKA